jgi:hypothetical protein
MWRRLISLSVLLALAACGGSAVFMDYNIAGLWSNYRTYNWLPEPRAEDIGPLAENPANRTSIEDAVDWAMKNRGLRRDEANPDLLVAYYAGKKDAIDPSVWGYSYSAAGSYKDEQGPPQSYKGGTLVIDLIDAKTKELMWRGWSDGVINAPNQEKTDNSIREVTKKIMAEYPPR